jgi:MFS family permease
MENSKNKLWTASFIYACLANFLMGFSFYLLIPTLPFYIVEHFKAPKSMVGIVMSCYVIAAVAIRPLSGFMVDSFSRKHVYVISYILFVWFCAGYVIAGSLFLIVVLRILHGFTWGTITTAGNTLAIDIMPSSKRGEGIGYYGMAINFSMALGPVVGLFLYERYNFGYIFYAALVSAVLGLFFSILIKAPAKDHIHHKQPFSFDRFILIKGLPIGINLVFMAVSYGMVLSFAAMYGKEINVSHTGMFFTLLAVGIGVSRIFSGKLIDKGRIHEVSIIGLTLLTASFLMFSIGKNMLVYYISALCIGVGFGIMIPAFQTLFINIATHHQRGTANSTFYTAFDIGVGLGMIIAGKIAETVSLSWAFGFSALLNALAVFYYWKISKASYQKYKLV